MPQGEFTSPEDVLSRGPIGPWPMGMDAPPAVQEKAVAEAKLLNEE